MSVFLFEKEYCLLEPCEGKLSRTVLRGESTRKGADLPDPDLSEIAYNHLLNHLDGYKVKPKFYVILKSATPFPKCYLHKEKWTFDS